jgi:hypothetical protein
MRGVIVLLRPGNHQQLDDRRVLPQHVCGQEHEVRWSQQWQHLHMCELLQRWQCLVVIRLQPRLLRRRSLSVFETRIILTRAKLLPSQRSAVLLTALLSTTAVLLSPSRRPPLLLRRLRPQAQLLHLLRALPIAARLPRSMANAAAKAYVFSLHHVSNKKLNWSRQWTGPTACVAGTTCKYSND